MLSTVDYGRSGFVDVGRGPDGLELKAFYLASALEHSKSRSERFPCLPISSKQRREYKELGGGRLRWAQLLDPVVALSGVRYLVSHR